MDDDHEDEEAAVFLEEELPPDDEESESSVADDREARIVQLSRRRVRHCLPGCDCERPYGRKCECERRGNGLCGDDCECDRSKCRTTAKDLSDEDDEEEEVEDEAHAENDA
jgi:hypothetical protein